MAKTAPIADDDNAPEGGGEGASEFGGRYLISTGETLRSMSTADVKAFPVADRGRPGESFAALVCPPGMAPRGEAMSALRGISKPGMASLVQFGPMNWPEGPQRMAAIYTMPTGGRFTLSSPVQPWQVVDNFLRPAALALKEIHGRGVTHRAIRPDNLFRRDISSADLALGPCTPAPAGYEQPAAFEPLESAAADPAGRGEGSARHDMFALGMTALSLVMGRQAGANMDPEEFMIRRIELGSLAAVIDPQQVPPEIVDALRSLLTDEESERWTLNDLHQWLNAGKPTLAPRQVIELAQQPFTLAGKQVRRARSLAYLIGRHPSEAAGQLAGGDMRRWVWNEAPEKAAAAEFDRALMERESEVSEDELMALRVSHVVMALDPVGPVRYSGLSIEPDALGPFLVDSTRDPARRATAVKLIRFGLPQKALLKRPRFGGNERRATRQAIAFENVRRWINSKQPWEGFDRCLYELNEHLPCLSPMTDGRWVTDPGQLLGALDKASRTLLRAPSIDASAAAFIASRLEVDGAALKALLNPNEADDDAHLEAIKMFAEIERRGGGGGDLSGLADWTAKIAHRFVDGFHHQETRRGLSEQVDQAAASGSISAVLAVVDQEILKERDATGFAIAKSEWGKLERDLTGDEFDNEAFRQEAWRRGQESVPLAAAGRAFLVFLITLFVSAFR